MSRWRITGRPINLRLAEADVNEKTMPFLRRMFRDLFVTRCEYRYEIRGWDYVVFTHWAGVPDPSPMDELANFYVHLEKGPVMLNSLGIISLSVRGMPCGPAVFEIYQADV